MAESIISIAIIGLAETAIIIRCLAISSGYSLIPIAARMLWLPTRYLCTPCDICRIYITNLKIVCSELKYFRNDYMPATLAALNSITRLSVCQPDSWSSGMLISTLKKISSLKFLSLKTHMNQQSDIFMQSAILTDLTLSDLNR